MKEIELIGKRKAREKHFLKEKGVMVAKVYDEDIHFLKDGQYEEIDNTLIEQGNYIVNRNNAYKVSFAKISGDELMQMKTPKHFIKINLESSNKVDVKENITKSKLHKNICYSNILDNIDLEYNIMPAKVKEAIILKNKNAVFNNISFNIVTDLELKLNDNKMIAALKNGKCIFEIETPYMVDAEFKTNNNICYELINISENEYKLKLVLDENWLKDDKTKYPIMIDPTITNSGQENSVYDTYIYEGDTGVDRNSQDMLKVGVENIDGVNRINRTLIKFDLPTLGTGSQVISAELNIFGYPDNSYNYNSDIINIHRITCDWDENSANWALMNDKFDSLVEGILVASRGYYDYENEIVNPSFCGADITRLVRKWYSGTDNNGLLLKLNSEVHNPDILPIFYSKNNTVVGANPKPLLIVTYRNQNGIEDYMSYQRQSFDNCDMYVNNYNGNLTGIFDIGSIRDNKMPINLNLVYNTNDVVLDNDIGYGLGYRFNYSQTIKEQPIDGITYLEYTDDSGTLHYFLNEKIMYDESSGYSNINTGNEYYDEDGLNFIIIKNTGYYELKDKTGIIMKFDIDNDIGYLTEITDSSNNHIFITYSSNKLITKISNDNNEEINIIYSDLQTTILSPDRTIYINYLNDKLDNITSDLGIIQIQYNNNLISKVIGENGLQRIYEYYEQTPYKVKKVEEYGINNIKGNYINITYGFDTTTITDSKGRSKNYVFNSQAGIISTSSLKEKDDLKNAYAITDVNDVNNGTNQASNNKLLKSFLPVKYVKNYLLNTSFENDKLYFSGSSYVDISISNEISNTGSKSLKIISNQYDEQIISYSDVNLNVPKGSYYTFSAYVKNTNNLKFALGYNDENNQTIQEFSEKVTPSIDFIRYDVTIFYPTTATSELQIKIYLEEIGTLYIDDIQLETGRVANQYNILENSDFSLGLTDWILEGWDPNTGNSVSTSDKFELITLPDGNSALKIKKNPLYSLSMKKTINISGVAGDTYNLSFWYKNNGVISNLSMDFGSRVYVAFNYINQDDGHCELITPELNINDEAWQYVSNEFVAEKDYDSITVLFTHVNDANEAYITNINLFKDLRSAYFEYDENGNITLMNNFNNKDIIYSYDANNKLVQTINPNGKKFMIEYNNLISNQIINSISDMGISNKVIYDEHNNPVIARIGKCNNNSNDIISGLYRIRLKGTNKFVRNINNNIEILSDDCCHDMWNISETNGYFKIEHSIIENNCFTESNDLLILTNYDSNKSTFQLIKNKNGSYLVKLKDNEKYLYCDNGTLRFSEYASEDYRYEFYFEIYNREFIENCATYDTNNKYITSIVDSLNNVNKQNIDPNTGLTTYTEDAKGHRINYSYNSKRQLIEISEGMRNITCQYNNNNLISNIIQGNKNYNFEYSNLFNLKKIKLGDNIVLATKTYDSDEKNITSVTYGNGDTINYEYDEFDRITKITKGNKIYEYLYDNNANLVKVLSSNYIAKYNYDLSKRLNQYNYNDFKIKYIYDNNDNIIQSNYLKDDVALIINNEYNADELITTSTFDDNTINYLYDSLGRLSTIKINNSLIYNFEYEGNGNKTSLIIKKVIVGNTEYLYKYDNLYNIKEIYKNNEITNKYYYDEYEELIKEKDYISNIIIEYNYDLSGNILKKVIYDLSNYKLIKKDIFEYKNADWEDQLTKFNNDIITYDAIGNPILINNTKLVWENGRQLISYNDGLNIISYEYNDDGIRLSKTVNGIQTKYYLEGINVVLEETPNYMIQYIRGADDKLIAFKYNGTMYYYIRNLQDDIVAIVDYNYNIVAEYRYNSWGEIIEMLDSNGNPISKTQDHIANINPYRYRSYYYDQETEMYYLNSRYYNPKWGRFVSSDNYITNDYRVLGSNMYIYCKNNYINEDDISGHGVGLLIISLVLGAYAIVNDKKKRKKAVQNIKKIQKKKKDVKDKTKEINQKLQKTKSEVKKETEGKNFVERLKFVYDTSNDGKKYDLKLQDDWGDTVIYDNLVMEAQDVGNFHFGYLGRAAGIPLDVLRLGAGANQLKKYGLKTTDNCLSSSYCDDMRDTIYIELGAMKYDNEN